MAQAQVDIVLSNGQKAGETLKELGKTANKLNKEIKDLKPGTNDFVKKAEDLQKVNAKLKDVKDQVNGVSKAQGLLSGMFERFVPFSGQIKSFGEGFNSLRGGVGGVTKGFGALKGAIVATGIGALVILITGLAQWLMKSQKGMDLVSKAMAAAGAVVNVLIKRIGILIEGFALIISGKFKQGFDRLGDSIQGIGKEIIETAGKAAELDEALKKLQRSETDMTLIQARRKRLTEEMLSIFEDETNSYDKRRKALADASAIEKAALNDSIALQTERLRIAREEFNMSDGNEEKRKAMIEAQVKLEEMQAESIKALTELRKKDNELAKKQEADAVKAWENRAIIDEVGYKNAALKSEEEIKNDLARKTAQANKSVALKKKENEEKLAANEAYADEEERKHQEAMDRKRMQLDATLQIAGGLASVMERGSKQYKAVARAEVILAGIREVQTIWAHAMDLGPVLGPIYGTVLTGIALVRTGKAIASIDALPVPKYQKGGVLRGPSHAEGGIAGVAGGSPIEMEGDEIILTGAVSRDPMGRAAASALNYRYGGIQFQNGGPVNPLAQTLPPGAAGSGAVPGLGANTTELADAITRSLARMLPIVLKVQNNVQETRRGIQVINELEEASNF